MELIMPAVISVAVVIIVIIPIAVSTGYLYISFLKDRDTRARSIELDALSDDLEMNIELHMVEMDIMDGLLSSAEDQSDLDLYYLRFSEAISISTTSVVGVVVVRGADILFTYPEGMNDHARNWSSMAGAIPGISEAIDEMMTKGTSRLMGPFELWDGRTCLVAGNPISDPWEPWEFQVIILDLTVLLSEAGFMDDDLPFDTEFRDRDGNIFFGEGPDSGEAPIVRKLQVRNVEWEVVAYPKREWTKETAASLTILILVEIIIAILTAVILYIIARNRLLSGMKESTKTEDLKKRSDMLVEEVEKRKKSQKELAEANINLEVSLKEVNTLLKLSRLHLEGHEGLDEVFGRAVKIIGHNLLDKEDMCISIIFDNKVHAIDCPKDLPLLYRTVITVKGNKRGAVVLRCKNSPENWSDSTVSKREKRVIDSIGSQLGAISERWFTQQEEMEARNQAQFYLDLMSHDINNLHQGILINLELLRMGLISEEKREATLLTSMDLTKRSIKLVSNVKLLSFLKGLKDPLESVELNEIVVESIKEVRSSFAGRTVDITMEMPGDQMFILADKLVSEVLINILNNGVKVQQAEVAKMKVEVGQFGEKVRVSISDHGPGIRDSDKSSLFERHTGNKREKLMSGIGLSLVKVLMDRYKGRVWIEDRIRGRSEMGSKFVLEFTRTRVNERNGKN